MMPRDIPIIFSSIMVNAILSGRKTMTRRLATSPLRKCGAGDRLYVRESHWRYGCWVGTKKAGKVSYRFRPMNTPDDMPPLVYDDMMRDEGAQRGKFGDPEPAWHLRPSIFMPREDSRITLIVTANKSERLQDISDEDGRREGCELFVPGHGWITEADLAEGYSNYLSPRAGFENIWRALHGNESWDANPEVVALSFCVVRRNIGEVR